METIKFKKLTPDAVIPMRATAGSAGMDLTSTQDAILEAGKVTVIPTSLSVALPLGYELQVRARSGLASKGVMVVNGIGTIDSDYRGEIKVLATVLSESRVLPKGSRVAQAVVCKLPEYEVVEVEDFSEAEKEVDRGGGFGSTGA